jgi:hypothetical protein
VEAYQERVVAEREELQQKWSKLGTFLGGTQYQALPEEEQQRLRRQHAVMGEYLAILTSRIVNFH